MDPSTYLLANVVAFINKDVSLATLSPTLSPQMLDSVSSAASRIIATMSPDFARLSPLNQGLLQQLRIWAAGHFEPNEVVRPHFIAAPLLWAEIFKRGI